MINFSETVAKAQTEAMGSAVVKLAKSVVTYLEEDRSP